MDQRRFDSLTRSLAASRTRRGLLGVTAALAAGLVGRSTAAQVTQAQCGNVICASNPGICKPGCVCCVYSNGNSRCRAPQDCTAPGTVLSPPTTTAAPTTTTTTTVGPATQGTCPEGANVCVGERETCNSNAGCVCVQGVAGGTFCVAVAGGVCGACSNNADCDAVTGAGSVCHVTGGDTCFHCEAFGRNGCSAPCPT